MNSFKSIVRESDELEALGKISLEAVITTNYDTLLEMVFSEYEVFNGQDELIIAESYGAGEIYKIHGCVSSPSSIVITDEDYKRFEERNLILAAKLLTLIVEHPVVFLGYSLSDENVKTILTSIVKCLDKVGLDRIRDNIYIVEWNETHEESITAASFRIGNIDLPYTHIRCQRFMPIFEAMGTFERKIPIKLLRKLKQCLYELVEQEDPTDKLVVINLDEDDDLSRAEFVVGVGVRGRIRDYVSKDDVYRYALEGGDYDPELIVQKVLPDICKGNSLCPVFRFLSECNRISNGTVKKDGLSVEINKRSDAKLQGFVQKIYSNAGQAINASFASSEELLKSMDPMEAIYKVSVLDPSKIDVDLVAKFLLESWEEAKAGGNHISAWRKLVCYIDCLKFGIG